MFSVDDTIAAIATPLGRGGLGVVRLSGPAAAAIGARLIGREGPLRPRHATFAVLSGVPPARVEGETRSPTFPVQTPAAAFLPLAHGQDSVRDQVVVTYFPGPHSYTGDDVVELSAHGSPVVLEGIVRSAIALGARLAEPGEFTLRAFLNGKLDLIQAEAVGDLIDAVTPLQARAAFDQLEGTLTARIGEIERALFELMARLEASLDFPDEGYHFVEAGEARALTSRVAGDVETLLAGAARGRLIREGAQVAIAGKPNVGKSSLFNALLNANRAIVTPIPGTTRDLVTERANIGGISVALVDTAGIREALDVVEREGVERARGAAGVADVVLLVLDRSRPLDDDDRALLAALPPERRIVVGNKADLPAAWTPTTLGGVVVETSAQSGEGLDELVRRLAGMLVAGDERDRDWPAVSNVRHTELLRRAWVALKRADVALAGGEISEEFVLADLQDAAAALQEITGQRTAEDLLAHIFSRFCIGK